MTAVTATAPIKQQPMTGTLTTDESQNGNNLNVTDNNVNAASYTTQVDNKFRINTLWRDPNKFYTNENGEGVYFGESVANQDLLQDSIKRNVNTMIAANKDFRLQLATIDSMNLPEGWKATTSPLGVIIQTPDFKSYTIDELKQMA